MKNPFVIVGSVFALGILALVFFGGDKSPDVPEYDTGALAELERPEASPGSRMLLAGETFIEAVDITEKAVNEYPGGVYVLVEERRYEILYYANSDLLLISLLDATNFAAAREEAEAALPSLLGVTQTEVCQLNLDLTIPPFIDFSSAGSYGVSYCEQSVPLP